MSESRDLNKFIQVICLAPFAAAWKSYVMVIMWGWFVVPMGIHQIQMAHAYGLCITLQLFHVTRQSDDKPISEIISWAILFPLATLGYGYVTHLCMTW